MLTNRNCILRLSRYRKALSRLRTLGFKKVFSDNLADAIGVTPSQVRKDFSLFDITGSKKGGYNIEDLLDKLGDILGKNEIEKVVLAGYGHIGKAMETYKGFKNESISIVAVFDNDRTKLNAAAEPPVLPVENMEEYIRENGIKTGIIAVPDLFAQSVLDVMIRAGIKGVLNFAPIRLRAPEDFIITNVNLEMEMEAVIYFVNAQERQYSIK